MSRKDPRELGGKPRFPLHFTKHAKQRFAERFAKTNDVDAEMEAAAKAAVWAGKTKNHYLVLANETIWFVVRLEDYKYAILTCMQANGPLEPLVSNHACNPSQREMVRRRRIKRRTRAVSTT
jgi:hypothetical protein